MAEIEAQFETLAALAAEHSRLAGAIASLCGIDVPISSPEATAAALGRFGSRVRSNLTELARLHLALAAAIRAGADRYSALERR